MLLVLEVISRFQQPGDADHLLYAPLKAGLTYRHSRVYRAEIEGDTEQARRFLHSVLVDKIAQELSESGTSLFPECLFCLDYEMKPGALDLEKEAILTNYKGRAQSGLPFELKSLKITQRVYLFGQGDKEKLSAKFVKDICNPAIHRWNVA